MQQLVKGERPKLFCTYCKKDNHTEDRCFKKQRDNGITPTYHTSNASVATAAVAFPILS
jgi:hypothetical protein